MLLISTNATSPILPPIIISYLRLTKTIKTFGTAWNPYFGNVMETALLVTIGDIDKTYKKRYIDTYKSTNPSAFL